MSIFSNTQESWHRLDISVFFFFKKTFGWFLCRDPLTDCKVSDCSMERVGAVQVHPLVCLWAVNSDAVFQSIAVVRFSLNPVGVTKRLTTWPAPGALLVHIVASKPPSRETEGSSVRNLDVLLNLCLLVGALRLSKVTLVVVAAFHGIEPAHAVTSDSSVRVASAVIKVLDEHIALSSSVGSIAPTIVRITAKGRLCSVVCLGNWAELQPT